jgi:alpha-L-rhamnosidase
MFKHIGGIQPDPENPGFKNIIIKPQIGGGISCASMHYDTTHGRVTTHWWIREGELGDPNELHLRVGVPVNTTATIYIPGIDTSTIFEGESGETLAYLAEGVVLLEEVEETHALSYELESGEYHFVSVSNELFPFSCSDNCQDCLDCEADDGSKPCHDCNPDCNPPVE